MRNYDNNMITKTVFQYWGYQCPTFMPSNVSILSFKFKIAQVLFIFFYIQRYSLLSMLPRNPQIVKCIYLALTHSAIILLCLVL